MENADQELSPLELENQQLKERLSKVEDEMKEYMERLQEQQAEWERRFTEMDNIMTRLMGERRNPESESVPSTESAQNPRVRNDSTPQNKPTVTVPLTPSRDQVNIQVEHLVRSETNRIRPFSGNTPKGGESTFEDWAKQIELMLEDASLPAAAKKQKLLCSLHCPALDIARKQSGKSAEEIYCYLVEFYAPASNGVTLLSEYFSTCMKDQESNIDYIQRLSVMLDRVVKNGGLQEENVQRTLLTHFKSTCRDERVANAIHAKFTSDSPPSQLELIKEIRRTEEDFRCVPQKRDSKKAFAHGHHANGESSILTNIQSQMQMLQQQMSQLQMKPAPTPVAPSPPYRPPTTGHHNSSARPAVSNTSAMINQPQRVFICFNCGRSDGHRRRNCPYPSDPRLVHRILNNKSDPLNYQGPHRQ